MTAPGDVHRPDGTLATVPSAGIADEDTRILLRPMTAGDAPRWLESLHDPDQRRLGTPAFVHVPDDVGGLAQAIVDGGEAHLAGQPAAFAIADAEDPQRFLGTISWRTMLPAAMRIADVGYGIHPDSRGRGVATAALSLLTRWLLLAATGPGLRRVQLDHSLENVASCRVATKAGLRREGMRRGYLPLADAPGASPRWHDVCLHGTTPHDLSPAGRERAAVLPVEDRRVALMHRRRGDRDYLVPLGGGIEAGEGVEQAAARELREEAGLIAGPRPDQLWVSIQAGQAFGRSWQHLFVVRGWRGDLTTGEGPEYAADRPAAQGSYIPTWVALDAESLAPVVPPLLARLLVDGLISRG